MTDGYTAELKSGQTNPPLNERVRQIYDERVMSRRLEPNRAASLSADILDKARSIELLLTDCDGVLTDGGVYYSDRGEQLKKFQIRDGMAVERLKKLVDVETGIITGEQSMSVKRRAEKLGIEECHLGVKDKAASLRSIAVRRGISLRTIAYIGDDLNDLDTFSMVGLSACPSDAMKQVKSTADIVCRLKGGQGVFREFAEVIITARIGRKY
jgi:3-deoxy-D-manno-octulosonate 8-phosphate phosphatase (KDO 8-P phosphatase)